MSFSFNFGGDEIDDEDVEAVDEGMGGMEVDEDAGGDAELLKPCKLELNDLVSQCPSGERTACIVVSQAWFILSLVYSVFQVCDLCSIMS